MQTVFDELKIDATVVGITHGPNVDRYEVVVGKGTKINKVIGLQKHLSYVYGADVRISNIPGRTALGIEVPAPARFVRLPEVRSADPLTITMGLSIDGPVQVPLSDLPHMLVAGATGSGKSVFINSIICDLISKNLPSQLKMILIDPKRVELNQYAGIPHLIGDIVNEPLDADNALRFVVSEMLRRYDLMQENGVRHAKELDLPTYVVIIDELADLMMVSAKTVEKHIVRLTQLARAAGIHLIVATQRPSVDVVTGLIKANIPARLAFRTSSAVDSRVIMDRGGAELLQGRGDGLYNGLTGTVRIQAPFVSDAEIDRLTTHWKS